MAVIKDCLVMPCYGLCIYVHIEPILYIKDWVQYRPRCTSYVYFLYLSIQADICHTWSKPVKSNIFKMKLCDYVMVNKPKISVCVNRKAHRFHQYAFTRTIFYIQCLEFLAQVVDFQETTQARLIKHVQLIWTWKSDLKKVWNFILLQGLYTLSGRTSCLSWILETARLDIIIIVSLGNYTGFLEALLPRHMWNFRAIGNL